MKKIKINGTLYDVMEKADFYEKPAVVVAGIKRYSGKKRKLGHINRHNVVFWKWEINA